MFSEFFFSVNIEIYTKKEFEKCLPKFFAYKRGEKEM
jgi:hypothetical protein